MKKLILILLLLSSNISYSIPYDNNITIIDSNKSNQLQSFINEWWQVPYKWGGMNKKGIDCSAFIQKIYNQVYNINIPRTCITQYKKCVKITKQYLNTGDLIFFKMGKNKWHVGIYLTNDQFAHASCSKGVWISDLNNSYWKNHYFSSGKILS